MFLTYFQNKISVEVAFLRSLRARFLCFKFAFKYMLLFYAQDCDLSMAHQSSKLSNTTPLTRPSFNHPVTSCRLSNTPSPNGDTPLIKEGNCRRGACVENAQFMRAVAYAQNSKQPRVTRVLSHVAQTLLTIPLSDERGGSTKC